MINSLYAGLVSFWPLHEASGTRYDLTGCANHLTDNNTVTQNPGIQEWGAQFTAANSERLNIASNANIQTGDIDYTIAFWAYMDTKPTTASWYIKYSAAAGNYEYQVYHDGTADRWKFVVARATDSPQTETATNAGSVALSTWHLVMCWHDATADTANIQINAIAPDSAAMGGALQAAGTAELSLGAVAGANFVNGRMAEAGFWKRLLTNQERLWLYNKGRGRTYPFDGRLSPAMLGRHTYMVGPRRSRLVGMAA